MVEDAAVRRLSGAPARARPLSVLLFLGTRPEAVKLAPVVLAAREAGDVRVRVASSGQHPAAMLEVLERFEIAVDVDLGVFRPGQGLTRVMCAAMEGLDAEIRAHRPDVVLVQGDTTSALAGGMAAFHAGVPVGHVEAGLRTHDLHSPFPEEANRRLIDTVADVLFAPTPGAAANLAAEGVEPGRIFVSGNTVCDALAAALPGGGRGPARGSGSGFGSAPGAATLRRAGRQRVLVTAHRRESWGRPMDEIAAGLADAASRLPGFEFLVPLHPNPVVRESFRDLPGNVAVTAPLPYWTFVRALASSALLVTDSGGAVEEAAALGVPTLVLRRRTERPEALEAGARLVGTDRAAVAGAIVEAVSGPDGKPRTGSDVFGDGAAGRRIVGWLRWRRGLAARPPAPFVPRAGRAPLRAIEPAPA